METGKYIKYLRTQKGWTQEELGEKLGVQKSAIAKYENGRVENLKRSTIQKLAELFNVSPLNFLGIEDNNEDFTFSTVDEAMLFIIQNPTVAAYGGYDLDKMSDEDKIEFANQIADTIKFFGNKYNK